MSAKFDLYQIVTDRVIALMQEHGANWQNPFNKRAASYKARNAVTGNGYHGMNQFLLGTTAYPLPLWAGFQQWKSREKAAARVHYLNGGR